jgi:predicted transposase/invertase (TIGR01784 family)
MKLKIPKNRPSPNALLCPMVDWTFKRLFSEGSPESNEALKSLIEAIIGRQVHQIHLSTNEIAPDMPGRKKPRLDVHCVFNNGERADVEMQCEIGKPQEYMARSEVYAAYLLAHSTKEGRRGYRDTHPVWQISLLGENCFKAEAGYLHHFTFRTQGGLTLHSLANIMYLELAKIENKPVELLTKAEKWGIFFREANIEEQREFLGKVTESEKGLQMAQTVLDRMSAEESAWYAQYDAWKYEYERKGDEALRKESEAKLARTRAKLARAEAQLTDTESRLTDTESRLTDTESRLTDAKSQLTERDVKLAERDARIAELEAMLQGK